MSDWQCWTCKKRKNISLNVKMQILVRQELRKRSRKSRLQSQRPLGIDGRSRLMLGRASETALQAWRLTCAGGHSGHRPGVTSEEKRNCPFTARTGMLSKHDHHGSDGAFVSRRESLHPQGKLRIWEHCAYVQSLSRVRLFVTPWTVALQPLLFMGFSRQEYWGRLPFPPPGDLPDPGVAPTSPVSPALVGRFFTTEPPGKLIGTLLKYLNVFKFQCKRLCFPCSSVL